MLTLFFKSLGSAIAIAAIVAGSMLAAENDEQLATESVKAYLKEHPQAAVTIGIVDTDGTQVFGFGQLKKDDPASQPDGNTIYQIGSITKTFTTTILAEQVTQGHMQLIDPAQKYLSPDLVLPIQDNREITLEELATHHSGLPRMPQLFQFYFILGGETQNPYASLSWQQIANLLPKIWLENPIGSKYSYSNLGMGILGEALVRATKKASYEELVKARILEPLGMRDTGQTISDRQQARIAPGHFPVGVACPWWRFGALEGCGALFSTVNDLLIFAAANVGLKESPLADATKLAQDIRPNRNWSHGVMGLGWHIQIDPKTKTKFVWHNGATFGNTSMLFLVPEKKLGIVVLSNVGAAVDSVAVDLARKILDKKPPASDGQDN